MNFVKAARRLSAFTIIEMLVVISILGIIAALAVPALKDLGKANITVSAARQLLDDVGRARQLAISQRTTVYMVFVPAIDAATWAALPPIPATTNLADKQLTGYNFVTLRSVGDQPGWGAPSYLSEWKSLPDGAFIALQKFYTPASIIRNPVTGVIYPIRQFQYTNNLPFPVESRFANNLFLPFIAFNYQGQLTTDGVNLAAEDEYIPLAQGTVSYATDRNKTLLLLPPLDATEKPPGNSTNISYNVIHIDALTGRARLEYHKVK